jgi:hypothetical protein
MKKRSLSQHLFSLFVTGGKLQHLTDLVKNDPYLDMEFRGDCVMIYYRGGRLLTIYDVDKYEELALEYYPPKSELHLEAKTESLFDYISRAKQLVDAHESGNKQKLGEKEFQQRIVFENNLSVNASNTDYFIADVEWADNESLGGRADIIAFRWNHLEHSKRILQMTLIEVKQGEHAVETKEGKGKNGNVSISAGLKKHYADFLQFKSNPEYVKDVAEDMLIVLKQKKDLGLVKGLENLFMKGKENICPEISADPDFIFLLANYHHYSSILARECQELPDDCKFFMSSFMGYGLYKDFVKTKKEIRDIFPSVFNIYEH